MASNETCLPPGRALIADYANYFEVGHNAYEFLVDFGQIDPQSGVIHMNSRFAVGPTHAKLLSRLLQGAVAQFETQFGQIPDVHDDDPLGTVLAPSPEFERRAMDARRRPVFPQGKPSRAKASKKR